jgi:4-alpha-glucanotransferase
MTMAEAWGVAPGYYDIEGRWVPAEPETVCRVLDVMGAEGVPPAPQVLFVHAGQTLPLAGTSEVVTEDGAVLRTEALPPDLPPGYHTLRQLDDGTEARLIVSPGCCYLPAELRAWGWAAQLYAVRSLRSWGVGDLGDLCDLARWAARLGAQHLLVNPLDAPLPLLPQEPSPYYPSSRRFRNPLYIRIEDVPGAARLGERLERLARAGRDLNRQRLIERDRVFQLKMRALEDLFATAGTCDEFDRYRQTEGKGLTDFATFCALTEVYGGPWQSWPP